MEQENEWGHRMLAAAAEVESPVAAEDNKTQLRGVRFSPDLDRAVIAKAKEMGMGVSQFLRFAAERLLDVRICSKCKGTGIVKGVK